MSPRSESNRHMTVLEERRDVQLRITGEWLGSMDSNHASRLPIVERTRRIELGIRIA